MKFCKLRFKAKTNCSDPTVTDFDIQIVSIATGNPLASFTGASNPTTSGNPTGVDGITFLGTSVMDGFNVDVEALPEPVEVRYNSFTTVCGLQAVNEVTQFEPNKDNCPSGSITVDNSNIQTSGIIDILLTAFIPKGSTNLPLSDTNGDYVSLKMPQIGLDVQLSVNGGWGTSGNIASGFFNDTGGVWQSLLPFLTIPTVNPSLLQTGVTINFDKKSWWESQTGYGQTPTDNSDPAYNPLKLLALWIVSANSKEEIFKGVIDKAKFAVAAGVRLGYQGWSGGNGINSVRGALRINSGTTTGSDGSEGVTEYFDNRNNTTPIVVTSGLGYTPINPPTVVDEVLLGDMETVWNASGHPMLNGRKSTNRRIADVNAVAATNAQGVHKTVWILVNGAPTDAVIPMRILCNSASSGGTDRWNDQGGQWFVDGKKMGAIALNDDLTFNVDFSSVDYGAKFVEAYFDSIFPVDGETYTAFQKTAVSIFGY